MSQPNPELQQAIKSLNASLELPPAAWIPTVGAWVTAIYFGEEVNGIVLSCPGTDPDPQRRISAWKIRLESGKDVYIWKLEDIEQLVENEF